jgi:hypothetical protein
MLLQLPHPKTTTVHKSTVTNDSSTATPKDKTVQESTVTKDQFDPNETGSTIQSQMHRNKLVMVRAYANSPPRI